MLNLEALGQRSPPATVTFSLAANLYPLNGGLSLTEISRGIDDALSLWAGAAPLDFVQVPYDGRLVFGQGVSLPSVLAVTSTIGLPASVSLSPNYQWNLTGGEAFVDLVRVETHEIGHALGFDHSADPDSVMFAVYHDDFRGAGRLDPESATRIRALYGMGVGSVTPLPAGPIPDSLPFGYNPYPGYAGPVGIVSFGDRVITTADNGHVQIHQGGTLVASYVDAARACVMHTPVIFPGYRGDIFTINDGVSQACLALGHLKIYSPLEVLSTVPYPGYHGDVRLIEGVRGGDQVFATLALNHLKTYDPRTGAELSSSLIG